ncbi:MULTISPECIES: response regulator transcription factor [Streptomyces]|uniref:response regulator transcription factor n=1 Tax=Streptomyces TaxID=1883 RepID=UPI00069E3F5F|nr:helix-turn-helix transcriptional regulator [Streptomyces virginiae]
MRVVSFTVPAWFPSYEETGAEGQAPHEDASNGDGPAANGPAAKRPAANRPAADGSPVDGSPAGGPAANGPAAIGPAADRPASDRPTPDRTADAQLTEQESAVFLCLATGASNRELAAELQLSVSTVKFHVVNIRAKLGGISRLQACLLAALAREDTLRAARSGHCARTGPGGLSDGGAAAARR